MVVLLIIVSVLEIISGVVVRDVDVVEIDVVGDVNVGVDSDVDVVDVDVGADVVVDVDAGVVVVELDIVEDVDDGDGLPGRTDPYSHAPTSQTDPRSNSLKSRLEVPVITVAAETAGLVDCKYTFQTSPLKGPTN